MFIAYTVTLLFVVISVISQLIVVQINRFSSKVSSELIS